MYEIWLASESSLGAKSYFKFLFQDYGQVYLITLNVGS